MSVDKKIGQRIKQLRIKQGLSQDELAQKLGYKSRSSINKIELGINDITQTIIQKLAVILKTTPGYLMGWADDEEQDLSEKKSGDFKETSTDGEKELLTIYRSLNTNGQSQLLNMARLVSESKQYRADNSVKVYRAASSTDHHLDEITEISREDYERAKNSPDVTSEDSDI